MIFVKGLEGKLGLAGHLNIGDHLVLILVEIREHLWVAAVADEVILANLWQSNKNANPYHQLGEYWRLRGYFVSKYLAFSVRKLWDALNLSVFDLNLLHFQFLEEVFDEYFT